MVYIIQFMSLISFCCALSIDNTNKPIMLFNELYSDKEWELLDSDNDLSVYTKSINNKNLKAVMVKQELALPKDVLQDVIMDIGNYKNFYAILNHLFRLKSRKLTFLLMDISLYLLIYHFLIIENIFSACYLAGIEKKIIHQ